MPYIGYEPAAKPLTSADITDSVITSAKIVDGTIANADINSSAAIALSKLSTTGTASSSNYLRGDGAWNTPPAGAFVFLAETSASNVTSVDLNGYFTSDYDNYVVYLDGIYASASSQTMMQFATTGSYTVQTSSYYGQCHYAYGDGSSFSSNESQFWNTTYGNISVATSTTSTQTSNCVVTIYNPMGSNVKSYSGNFSAVNSNISWIGTGTCGGRWNSTTAITGLRFLQSSGNIYVRKIRLYGIKNS